MRSLPHGTTISSTGSVVQWTNIKNTGPTEMLKYISIKMSDINNVLMEFATIQNIITSSGKVDQLLNEAVYHEGIYNVYAFTYIHTYIHEGGLQTVFNLGTIQR